jgi:nitrite reductase/ring-hydroxylating ferredoxin subunit
MSDYVTASPPDHRRARRPVNVAAGGRVFNVSDTFRSRQPLPWAARRGRGRPQVSCPCTWTFDVTTGENVAGPDMKVARYEVKLEDGQVLVRIG